MLPSEHRLTSRQEFATTLRRGLRASRPLLTLHLAVGPAAGPTTIGGDGPAAPSRAGLVVSRAVGNSVVRHRTSRRLRHLLRPRLAGLPPGSLLVVRAAPPAGAATSAELAGDLDAAWRALERKAAR